MIPPELVNLPNAAWYGKAFLPYVKLQRLDGPGLLHTVQEAGRISDAEVHGEFLYTVFYAAAAGLGHEELVALLEEG